MKQITELKPNEIFVFGSNAQGNHAGGAAKQAHEQFGAQMGVGHGFTGQCYAIDTMSGLEAIGPQVDELILNALLHPELTFLVTEIGCGIAGHKPEQIRQFFTNRPDNVMLPDSFRIKGYKAFDQNMKCRGYQFESGLNYIHEGEIRICAKGFHFCLEITDCFKYYEFNTKPIICEVEAIGDIETHDEDSKVCTNNLKIGRQLSWDEVLTISNKGKNNLGYNNAGNYNAGNYNAGNDNAGNYNAGYYNAGSRNAGNYNAGNYNAGYHNAGNSNAGSRNAGNDNAGNYNAGNYNAGNYNAGNYNAGSRNAGNYNAGNYNAGSRNAGYSNAGNDNAGAFNTKSNFTLFDMPTTWTFEDFRKSKAFDLLHSIDTTLWVPTSNMTEQELKDYPYHVTTGGYNRVIPYKQAFCDKWNNWSEENRKAFIELPNFNWNKFTFITGVPKPE